VSGWEGPSLPEWAVLFPLGAALGTSLYLGIFVLSVIHLVPGVPSLPGDLGLLAGPGTTAVAGGLYWVAWVVRGHPSLELLWGVGNIPVRFVAVGLLGLLVVPTPTSSLTLPALLAAASIAAFIQFLRVGWITIDHHFGWLPARRWIQRLGLEAAALGVLWATVLSPGVGLALASAALVVLTPWGRPFHWAGRVSVAAVTGAYRSLSGRAGWGGWADAPGWIRDLLEADQELRRESVRLARVGFLWRGRGRTIRYGRLVVTPSGAEFLFRGLGRPERVNLTGARTEEVTSLTYLREIVLSLPQSGSPLQEAVLLVPPGGPEPEELRGVFPYSGGTKNL
jgi:hypothetical protein